MQSSLIGKIEKAKRYAGERDRIHFQNFKTEFHGENADHTIEYGSDGWHCSCSFFSNWGRCSHTMAMEKILGNMLPPEARVTKFEETP